MRAITFKAITAEEWRIHQGGDYVGDVYCQADVLNAGKHYWVIHLHEYCRGPQRIYHRHHIGETADRLPATHPFYGQRWPSPAL